jgi:hypothetical protein
MRQLETFSEGKKFEYEWDDNNRIKIRYGSKNNIIYLDGVKYDKLIRIFKGKTVRIHPNPEEENISDWIYREGTKTRIAQYIGPILCWEKHAKKSDQRGKITFL